MLDAKYKGKKGTIIIEFYETEEYERAIMPKRVFTKNYEQHFIEDSNKKSFADSLRIKEGKTFFIGPHKQNFMGAQQNRMMGDFRDPYPRKRDQKFDQKKTGNGGRTFAFNEHQRNFFPNKNKNFNRNFKGNPHSNPTNNQEP